MLSGDFLGAQKLINLSLHKNKLLASSFDHVLLYNLAGKQLHDYQRNLSKTIAIFSPDGKYVLSGDEGGSTYVFNTENQSEYILWGLIEGDHPSDINNVKKKWLHGKVISQPKAFDAVNADATLSLKFIDRTHFLRFTIDVPYVILYKLGNPKPLKYIKLGKNPMPSVTDYTRDQSIDTSWKNHILVTGKAWDNGIIVYRYDPKTQTLKKIWQPSGSFWYAMRQWVEKLLNTYHPRT